MANIIDSLINGRNPPGYWILIIKTVYLETLIFQSYQPLARVGEWSRLRKNKKTLYTKLIFFGLNLFIFGVYGALDINQYSMAFI